MDMVDHLLDRPDIFQYRAINPKEIPFSKAVAVNMYLLVLMLILQNTLVHMPKKPLKK